MTDTTQQSTPINDVNDPQVKNLVETLSGEHISSNNNSGKDSGKQALIFRIVMENKVCPFGLKSLDALKQADYDIIDRHITNEEENTLVKNTLGVKSTPQTFINGKHIGGNDDLQAFLGNAKDEK